ncbi:hypothetical protein BpHYR1_048343 [Brachionus plicatilis]|uniref:Lipocalin/cytosolic fatty-acid binding domain-containing protein n=1 Tax=Brachionus plicatilis TaxID=10195 RepID=A0A3M7PPF0_BRAPC|nr:hypothetical protein BpHYR1_048343 [Brachionus plicatilis]
MNFNLFLILLFSEVLVLSANLASIRYPEFPFPPKICLKFSEKPFNLTQILGDWYPQIISEDYVPVENKCSRFNFKKSNESIFTVTLNQSKPFIMNLEYKKNSLFGSKRLIVSPALYIDVLMEYQIVYFDDKYLLVYACGNFHVYSSLELIDSYYLFKREREFNNFDEIFQILLLLRTFNADLNKANLVINNASC